MKFIGFIFIFLMGCGMCTGTKPGIKLRLLQSDEFLATSPTMPATINSLKLDSEITGEPPNPGDIEKIANAGTTYFSLGDQEFASEKAALVKSTFNEWVIHSKALLRNHQKKIIIKRIRDFLYWHDTILSYIGTKEALGWNFIALTELVATFDQNVRGKLIDSYEGRGTEWYSSIIGKNLARAELWKK